ncbi:MAG TPA: MFS transporter [Candidatus Binatia bacterium]|nr:MFS transporter [Candidatus Binatia bacterium]
MSQASPASLSAPAGIRPALGVRNFRLLWIGETVSLLGDQFYLVALPWLALQLRGSGLALGSVLMTAAIPRAALMLAGGAATDRFSSRAVMLVSNIMRCAIVVLLALLVYSHAVRLWHLYLIAAAFGAFDAFFYPAWVAIVPAILPSQQLAAGNSLMQGSVQLTGLIGPATAGALIGAAGLAAAFGVDAASFVVSIIMLALITTSGAPAAQQPLFAAIREGVAYALAHPVIRSLLVAYATMNLFLTGPFMVGAPLLAWERFGGATALGLLFSSFGAGALLGTLAAGRDRRQRRLGPLLLTVYGAAGTTMTALGLISRLWVSAAVLLLLGVIVGYSNVQMLAYLQRQTEPDKMGRVMSMIMFCAHGLLPVSYLLSGAISRTGVTVLFFFSGVTVIVVTLLIFRAPQFWRS